MMKFEFDDVLISTVSGLFIIRQIVLSFPAGWIY